MTLNVKALCPFETIYQSTQYNILEDLNFWQHHCENLNVTVLKINLIWFLSLPFKQILHVTISMNYHPIVRSTCQCKK